MNYRSPAHLPSIAGLTAVTQPNWREQWTSCYIGSLTIGEVFSLRNPGPDRVQPLVLTIVEAIPDPDREYPWIIGEARSIASGEPVSFKLHGDAGVLARCDLHYVTISTSAA